MWQSHLDEYCPDPTSAARIKLQNRAHSQIPRNNQEVMHFAYLPSLPFLLFSSDDSIARSGYVNSQNSCP